MGQSTSTTQAPSAFQDNQQEHTATVLDLSNKDFSDLKAALSTYELKRFAQLQQLYLVNCQLTNIEFVSTWHSTLTELDLSRNLLTTLDGQNEMLFFLKQLIKLNLSYNYISTISPMIFNLLSLQTLNLSNNNLSSLRPEMQYLNNLTDLDVSCNQLSALPPEIGSLTTLIKLKLSQNKLQSLPTTIGNLQNLILLSLSDNQLEELPNEITLLTNLRKLYLDNNELLNIPNDMGNMVSLRELSLNNNQLIDLPSSIAKLTNLTMIDIEDNLFEDSRYNTSDLDAFREFLLNKPTTGPRKKFKKKKGRDTVRVIPDKRPSVLQQLSPTVPKTPVQRKKRKSPLYRFYVIHNAYVLVDRVPNNPTSLNQFNVFLLDDRISNVIYIWVGDKSDSREKAKALHIANRISESYGQTVRINLLEGKTKREWNHVSPFWEALGVNDPDTKASIEKDIDKVKLPSDDEQLSKRILDTRLFRFSDDESSSTTISIVGDGEPLSRNMLDSTSAFVLDGYNNPAVYVWIGYYSSASSRSWALLKAEELKDKLTTDGASGLERQIIWCIDGEEMWDFKELFFDWMDDEWDPQQRERIRLERERAEAELQQLVVDEPVVPQLSPPVSPLRDTEKKIPDSPQAENVVVSPKQPKTNTSSRARRKNENARKELVARLNSLSPPHPSPLLPINLLEQIHAIESAEKTQYSVLCREKKAESNTGSNPVSRSRTLERTLTAFIGVDLPQNTHLLSGPKRAAAPTRRKAMKNPVRQRADMDAQREDSDSTQADAAQSAVNKAKAGIAAGGVGLGIALVNEAHRMFQQRRELDSSANSELKDVMYSKGMPRLIRIKGRRKILVQQVEPTSQSLNAAYVYVLDTGNNVIFQWNGAKSNRIEKGKAMDLCKNLKDKEMNGNARVVVLEQDKTDKTEQAAQFWKILGGKPVSIDSDNSEENDSIIEEHLKQFTNLYKMVELDDSQALDIQPELVARYPIAKEILDESFCYILDCVSELFVWCGNKSKLHIRRQTLKLAQELRAKRKVWCAPISRELPGGESVLFREKFTNWGYGPPIQVKQIAVGKNTAKVVNEGIVDALAVYNKKVERQEVVVDDGKGKCQIWRIVEFKKAPVSEEFYGQFFDGDSYLVLYSYLRGNKEMHMIYYWQGRYSSTNEKGTSAMLTVELGDEISKGNTKEVRVAMCQEPKHFLMLFKDKYIIRHGKFGSKTEFPALYQVHGHSAPYTKCIQVDTHINAFNSTACFIVITETRCIIWKGKSSEDYELEYAKHAAARLSSATIEIIQEGKEHAEFWRMLGLKTPPPTPFPVARTDREHPVRLYMSSMSTGQHTVFEVPPPFSQDDLTRHDCFILDTFHFIFVWYNEVSPSDLKCAMEFAVNYADKVPDGRPKPTHVFLIKAKAEPLAFTTHFQGWMPTPTQNVEVNSLTSVRKELEKYNTKYSYEDLVAKKFPPGIDTTKLETYLMDDEFEQVFGMDRTEFSKLPLWKQQKLKREKSLF